MSKSEQISLERVRQMVDEAGVVKIDFTWLDSMRRRAGGLVLMSSYLDLSDESVRKAERDEVGDIWNNRTEVRIKGVEVSPVGLLRTLIIPMCDMVLSREMIEMALGEGNVRAAEVIALFDPELTGVRDILTKEYTDDDGRRKGLRLNLLKITSHLMKAKENVLGDEEKIEFLSEALEKLGEVSLDGEQDDLDFQGELRELMEVSGKDLRNNRSYPWGLIFNLGKNNGSTIETILEYKKRI